MLSQSQRAKMPKALLQEPPSFTVTQLDYIFTLINGMEMHFDPTVAWDQNRVAACSAWTAGQRELLERLANIEIKHSGSSRALNKPKAK